MTEIERLRKERNEAIRKILSWPNDGWEEEVIRLDRLLLLAELHQWFREYQGSAGSPELAKILVEHEGSGK